MIVGKDELPETTEGYLVLPRRLGLKILYSTAILLVAGASSTAWVLADISSLKATDVQTGTRLAKLESDREEMVRMREQMRFLVETVKEIRDELKRR